MKHKKLIGIVATSALLLGSVATFAACGGDAHTIERVDEKQATCTEGGHAAYYKCTDEGCDKLFSDIEGKHEITWDDVEKTDPLGHDMKHVDAKAATCTEEGTNDHYHCDRCKLNFTDEAGSAQKSDAVINALGHDMEAVAKKIPVTGQPGVKAHYRCKRENAEYFDSFGDKKVTDENKHELEYNMLTTAPNGWYASEHDFSHVNDADPYMTISASNGLNVATSEFYKDIAFTARIQKSKSTREYVELFFENKSIYSVYVENGKIYHNGSTPEWDYDKNGYTNLADSWADGYTLSKGEQDSYEGDGLEVTLARTGKTVKVLVNGREVHAATLSDEYVSEPVQGVMRVWSAQPGEKYYFRAEPQTPTAAAPKVTVAAVDAAQGAVTLNKDANAYAYDDELVITIAPTANYIYDTFTVNGRDVTAFVNKGAGNFTYTTTATANVKIEVTFKEKEFGSIDASVTGKKNGVTGNSIANNAEYTLVGKFENITGTLSAGKIDKTNVIAGEYTLKIDGYLDAKITVAKDTPYTTAIALGYDMFSMLHTDNGGDGYYNLVNTKNDFAHQNDANGYLSVLNGSDGMWVAYTNDDYNDLYFTATFKKGASWDNRKAIQLVFADGKGIQFGLKKDGDGISYGYWYSDRYLLNRGEDARLAPEAKIGNLTAEQLTKYNGEGITVSVARKGSTILLLVDGKIVNGLKVADSYAKVTCKAAIVIEWAGAQDIGVAVSETFDFATPTFTLTQGQNGTVTETSGDTYSVWDKITLEIAPAADYRLKQLTVNGVVIAGNKTEYSFYPVAGENTVVPQFELIPYGSVNANVIGNKNGVTGNAIKNGTEITLTGADNVEYQATVTNGKINIAKVIAGTYTVKAAGYLDGAITVAESTAYETEIKLEYDMFATFGWYDAHQNFSHQNDADAYVTIKDSDGLNFVTKNAYNQVAITITVGKDVCAGERTGVMMTFDNKMLWLTVKKTDNVILEWLGDGNWDNPTIAPNVWGFEGNALTEEDLVTWNNNTMTVTLVRDGKNFHAFVNGTYRTTLSVNGYETQQTKAGVRAWGAVVDRQYHVKVEEDISSYLAATITLNTPEHGGVSASKTENVHLSDEITLTLTPNSGYRVKSVTVNGNALQINSSVYLSNTVKFTAVKANAVVVEFELITNGSLDATLTGKKNGVPGNAITDGTKIKLVGPKDYTVTVTGGKIALAQVETGTYAVKIDGYFDGTITVAADTKYETAIVLEYDMFSMLHTNNGDEGYYNLVNTKNDFAHQNDANGYLSVVNGSDGMWVAYTNDSYDDIIFSATFKEGASWDNRKAIQLVFDGGTGIQFGLKKDGDGISFGYWYSDRYLMNRGDEAKLAAEEKIGNLSAEQITKFGGEGITVSVARKGNKIALIVDGAVVRVLELSADYTTKKCTSAIIIEWAGAQDIGVSVSETVSDDLFVTTD